jgi:hypothetical protein
MCKQASNVFVGLSAEVNMAIASAHTSRHATRAAESTDRADIFNVVRRVASVTPHRVIASYGQSSVTYRAMCVAIEQMMQVTRSHRMDDRAAAVAAVFACLPALAAQTDVLVVSDVVDGAFAQILRDGAMLTESSSRRPTLSASRTDEIDLRLIADRLAGHSCGRVRSTA